MITESKISIYSNVFEKASSEVIPFDMFLENVQSGKWQDIVIPLRAIKEADAKQEAKKRVPCVNISGTFSNRNDDGLIEHSGFVGIDIDDVKDVEALKEILSKDSYVYAAFASIGGSGLCVIFKVTPTKHREAFRGISEYLYNNYKIVVDPTSINVSRLRFVSYDPNLYIATGTVPKFTTYPKDREPKKVQRIPFAQNDFEEIINQVISDRVNICESYYEWCRVGFALADQFGEGGRNYFHQLSSMSSKYEPSLCDRQYTNCLKHQPQNKKTTIATLYYYAKEAGINILSQRTKTIAHAAYHGKRSGLSTDKIIENLIKFEEIDGEDVPGIIKQVQDHDIKIEEGSQIEQLEMFIRQNYRLRRNEITRVIENDGVPMEQYDYNSIFIMTKKVFDSISFELVDRLINSTFIPTYNPIHIFFKENETRRPKGAIEKLFSTIYTKDEKYLQHFGLKWLVGAISAAHWNHSPLLLVLSGDTHGTGKTEWFRRLMPPELMSYYGESKLDAGKDDYLLMCQKWFIMDDEMGGKSKKENKLLKELTSKQTFSLREPYGRRNIDMRRLAVLCGTSNDNELLTDPTGNRRIIPAHVNRINHAMYNSIDKKDVFMEAYHLYKEGFDWQLSTDDVNWLNLDSASFQETSLEQELFLKYFTPAPEEEDKRLPATLELTCSEIKTELELITKQKLNLYRLGSEMKRLRVPQRHKKNGRTTMRYYIVEKTIQSMGYPNNAAIPQWEPPKLGGAEDFF